MGHLQLVARDHFAEQHHEATELSGPGDQGQVAGCSLKALGQPRMQMQFTREGDTGRCVQGKLHGLLRSPSAHSPHWSSSIFIDAHDPFGAAICCRAHGETEGPRLVGSSEELPVMEAHAIGHIRCSQTAANAGAQLATQQGFHEIHTITPSLHHIQAMLESQHQSCFLQAENAMALSEFFGEFLPFHRQTAHLLCQQSVAVRRYDATGSISVQSNTDPAFYLFGPFLWMALGLQERQHWNEDRLCAAVLSGAIR
mmetsp:Transcript_57953/g.126676  ORF Transcript_57953/g.126676 Transcript_57953/m.126676 type:complete len:255 (-) Transcript_57953:815-1579(-)